MFYLLQSQIKLLQRALLSFELNHEFEDLLRVVGDRV